MSSERIGIVHPGQMGITVAISARNGGNKVFWASDGRSAATRKRAAEAGLEDAGTLAKLCELCGVVVSVCPPEFAEQMAEDVAGLGYRGIYVDANAVSPERVRRMAPRLEAGGARFVDGGIIGPPATVRNRTWLYLAGQGAGEVAGLLSAGPIEVEVLEGGVGRASALKMCFAAYSKGSIALACSVLSAAEQLGVLGELERQWARNGPSLAELEREILRAAPKAWRFAGEMREIAATYEGAGLPGEFHRAAEEIFRRLGRFKDCEGESLEDVLDSALQGYTTKMSDRRSIEVKGLEHVNPIPNASRIGSLLVSGGIFGKDPSTGNVPEGIEAQCAQTFANIRTVLAAGGATPEDVIKLSVWLKDMAYRPVVNKYYVEMFPDEHSRPARHTFPTPDLREPLLVECEIMAVIQDKK